MSSQRPQDRQVFQDYIVKIRYSNQLPPPPNPPKLLEIPGTGLSSKYISAGYASRLAREQPLNIEADAELGMHIDLVGIPGVFHGDESAIKANPQRPNLHPADKALLKPLASLTKALGINDSSSFLRRTEYTASSGPQMFASGSSKDLLRLQTDPRRKTTTSSSKNDPKNILRSLIKGFDIAYPHDATAEDGARNMRGAEITAEEIKAWSNPKHPSKHNIQLLDSYPILPDIDAIPEVGAYTVLKFITNPVARIDAYEERLDQAILQPIEDPRTVAEYDRKVAEHKEGEPTPLIPWDYDFFLPEPEALRGIKRKFDVQDPDRDDESLYTEESVDGRKVFKYSRIRKYETYNQHGDENNVWNDSVAIALHNPETDDSRDTRLIKAAYLYPVSQRAAIRPKRKVGTAALEQEGQIDRLNVTVRTIQQVADDESYNSLKDHRLRYDPALEAPTNGDA